MGWPHCRCTLKHPLLGVEWEWDCRARRTGRFQRNPRILRQHHTCDDWFFLNAQIDARFTVKSQTYPKHKPTNKSFLIVNKITMNYKNAPRCRHLSLTSNMSINQSPYEVAVLNLALLSIIWGSLLASTCISSPNLGRGSFEVTWGGHFHQLATWTTHTMTYVWSAGF